VDPCDATLAQLLLNRKLPSATPHRRLRGRIASHQRRSPAHHGASPVRCHRPSARGFPLMAPAIGGSTSHSAGQSRGDRAPMVAGGYPSVRRGRSSDSGRDTTRPWRRGKLSFSGSSGRSGTRCRRGREPVRRMKLPRARSRGATRAAAPRPTVGSLPPMIRSCPRKPHAGHRPSGTAAERVTKAMTISCVASPDGFPPSSPARCTVRLPSKFLFLPHR